MLVAARRISGRLSTFLLSCIHDPRSNPFLIAMILSLRAPRWMAPSLFPSDQTCTHAPTQQLSGKKKRRSSETEKKTKETTKAGREGEAPTRPLAHLPFTRHTRRRARACARLLRPPSLPSQRFYHLFFFFRFVFRINFLFLACVFVFVILFCFCFLVSSSPAFFRATPPHFAFVLPTGSRAAVPCAVPPHIPS